MSRLDQHTIFMKPGVRYWAVQKWFRTNGWMLRECGQQYSTS